MAVEPFPLVEVSGPPQERGRQYGRQAALRIRRGIGHYGRELARIGLSDAEIAAMVRDFVPVIEAFDPAYVEEMRGIALGAEQPFEQIALLNARTEILKMARRKAAKPVKPSEVVKDDGAGEDDGCTGAVLLPEATLDGRLIHGQNWDWKVDCAETGVVLKVRRDDGPDFMTFTEAGGLARAGLNAAGIAISANYLESNLDYMQAGVPLALIRRKVLEQAHFALALRVVATTPKSASNNMIVSTAEGYAIDFECAPDEAFAIHPDGGILVHANHWISPVALGKVKETGLVNTPDSLYRDARVRQALARERGRLTVEHLRTALFDDFAAPWSVCRPPRTTFQGNLSATVAMILMQPHAGVIEICPLPALQRDFTIYRLHPSGSERSAA
ncbi:MAG: C45 family peptidase [Alphaproteobacteria bacterium]|nr:C45 family peptidase [Alphaproteobacteria bacterium]